MILNMVVPHLLQEPFMARRVMPPLPFIVTSLALAISRLLLHFTQYPCVATGILTSPQLFLVKNVSSHALY